LERQFDELRFVPCRRDQDVSGKRRHAYDELDKLSRVRWQ
jgi:hypothetical protein